MGICNEQIIDYLANRETGGKLSDIILNDIKEDLSIPKLTKKMLGGKVKNLEDALKVLGEAKKAADQFMGISPCMYNPNLEIFGILRVILNGLRIHATDPGCDGENITYLKGERRAYAFHTLLHEYMHAVSLGQLGGTSFEYRSAVEGFAEGSSLRIMRQGNNAIRKIALFESINWLYIAKGAIAKKVEGKRGRLESIFKNISKGSLRGDIDSNRLSGIGYSLFRLAEEKHGAGVYREVYNGNTKILFD